MSAVVRTRVGIDLTPVLPGGANGGAKPAALSLVRGLREARPDWDFVVFTAESTHVELEPLDGLNLRRECVLRSADASSVPQGGVRGLVRHLAGKLPGRVGRRLRQLWDVVNERVPHPASVPSRYRLDVLLCPFTALNLYDPAVPCVSVVHDLQHVFYPWLLTPAERAERDRYFARVFRRATRIVCVSEYVRGTVIEKGGVEPERVVTVPHALAARLPESPLARREETLRRHGLDGSPYVIYPANSWPHKNHRMLLTALGIHRQHHPGCRLVLVLTGAHVGKDRTLSTAARQMGFGDAVRVAGFVPDEELADLLAGASALVFPSLFEGFGMPILEAMAVGVPVFCSDVTSLPEVAGDAAVTFDPRRPVDLANALGKAEGLDAAERAKLVEAGRLRAILYGSVSAMVEQYLAVLEAVLGRPRLSDDLEGRFGDGWVGPSATVSWSGRRVGPLRLELEVVAPAFLPYPAVSLQAIAASGAEPVRVTLRKGESRLVSIPLGTEGGRLELVASPSFVPSRLGISPDDRALCFLLPKAALVAPDGTTDLLSQGAAP